MGKIVKVYELQLMDVFVFKHAEEYPCIYIGKTHYIEWSNTARKVWDWPERNPDDKVEVIGQMEFKELVIPPEVYKGLEQAKNGELVDGPDLVSEGFFISSEDDII